MRKKKKKYKWSDKDKRLVTKIVEEYQERLNLKSWKFSLRFIDDERFNAKDGSYTCAHVVPDPIYMKAIVTFYTTLLKQKQEV